jgi:hypothetical protein
MEDPSKQVKNDFNKNSISSAHTSAEAEAIVRSLSGFYDMVGRAPEEPGTLAKMAAYFLAKGITAAQVTAALNLCVEQCRFPVRLPDIMQRIPGYEVPAIEAEARAAWDTAVMFVEKYVGCDAEGQYGPEHGMYGAWGPPDEAGEARHPARYPQLSRRILDVVRRTGGWIQYKRMTEEDQPFQQKRFFEEYMAWTAVEQVTDFGKLLTMPEIKKLSMPKANTTELGQAQPISAAGAPAAGNADVQLNRSAAIVPELSPERKAALKLQLEAELAKRGIPRSVARHG